MSIVREEKLQLAKRSAKEADQCVAVAFVISSLGEQPPKLQTAADKNKFKHDLHEHVRTKQFDMPECLNAELLRKEIDVAAATAETAPAAPAAAPDVPASDGTGAS